MTKIIALDAGHGLKTSGKQTPDGIKEWTLNDKVRDKVVAFLKDYDVKIIFPDGNEGYTDEKLANRRTMYVNQKVDAAVSIHHNANTGNWNNATGVEVFTDRNETSQDRKLANCIYPKLVKYTGMKGRGIKEENWAVINQNKVPAVLVEGGFMDGREDYKIITSDAGQTAYARAVAEGLIEFLGLQKKSGTSTVTSKPAPTPSNGKIEVDGSWGPATTCKAQQVFGTVVDGEVSNQPMSNKQYLPNANTSSWEFKNNGYHNGSSLVKAIQRKVGTGADGWFGPYTVKKFQKFLGVAADGSMGPKTVKAFQTWLNNQ